jgi:hypothetical protein
MSACAPDGVEEIDKFSVVPRVIDAQPPNAAQSATIPKIRIEIDPPDPATTKAQPERARKAGSARRPLGA